MNLHLRGATVVDGTGAPARREDVAVTDGRIAAAPAEDAVVVDLDGLVLAPGFIDPHTHYDAQVFWDPSLTPSCWHGVTTAVMGNCGFGIAPTAPEGRTTVLRVLENVEGMPYDALEAGIDWLFETYPEYLDALDRLPLRINVASLLGHTPLRYYVLGDDATERAATLAERARMKALADEAIAAGAIGFSTSRSHSHVGAYGRPVPSRAAELDEIYELARAGGTFEATWGPDLFTEELNAIAADTGRPVTWAAVLATNEPGYAARVAAMTGPGVHPQIACKPLVVEMTLADPFMFANVAAFQEVLATDRAERATKYAEPGWVERAEAEVAERWGDPFGGAEVVDGGPVGSLRRALALPLDTRLRIPMINVDQEQVAELLQDRRLLLGLSDAGAHTSQLCDADAPTHLLGHWCRERGTLTLEDAVWRLTGHPAEVYGFEGRGRIAPGFVADLVAFDPATVGPGPLERRHDLPNQADRLVKRANGIEHVWVGGTAIDHTGEPGSGASPGRLLRGGRST
jgi:N-acyl-D-aspartate/D-glutamate deacylase